VAHHSGPESCVATREDCGEALTGEISRPAIEPRNQDSGTLTPLSEAESNTNHGANRKTWDGPTRSENLCMLRSLSSGSNEISSVSIGHGGMGGARKVSDRNLVVYADEKSDTPIRSRTYPNKGDKPAEDTEKRGVVDGSSKETTVPRSQNRDKCTSRGLQGVREASKRDSKGRSHLFSTTSLQGFFGRATKS